MSLVAYFIGAAFLSFCIGMGFPALVRSVSRWGKSLFVIVHPGRTELELRYMRPKGAYAKLGLPSKDGVASPYIGSRRYSFGNKSAFVINRETGSPLRVKDDSLYGIDGRLWLKKIHDTRVQQVQSSGALDVAAMAKYALIALVIIGVFVMATFGIGLKLVSG